MAFTILPAEMTKALDLTGPDCRILSLDCFDTLIWRNTHAPRDVFAELGASGGSPDQRRWAEGNARSSAVLHRNSNEVSIEEIYATMLPNATPERRDAAVQEELAAEARNCFAYRPTVELIKEAKSRGLRVVIVSDTYLSRDQLRSLIATVAGSNVSDLIDDVFCSSEYGLSKGEGLFRRVLRALKAEPRSLLHIGDNRHADFVAPSALGIPALHLVQFSPEAQQRFRLEAAVGSMIHSALKARPAYQPHRATLASAEPQLPDGAARLGYCVLGPIFRAFTDWLKTEAADLRQSRGGNVHLLFLMRDGFLPLKAFEADPGSAEWSVAPVEISRFTATASSFASDLTIDRYLEREAGSGELARVARQLLFSAEEQHALGANSSASADQIRAFIEKVRRASNLKKIRRRSAAFGERLIQHVRANIAATAGDTIMLVDLGYNGSVQNSVDALLSDALQVHVAGRYLLLREQEVSLFDKKGLIDARNYDAPTLDAYCGSVAVLEQLCTLPQGSVVDYDDGGTPIRNDAGVKSLQSAVRSRVQEACVEFCREHGAFAYKRPRSETDETCRQAAAASMARLFFLPSADELQTLQNFEHDVNLGTEEMVPLFDREQAVDALREQGMFYLKGANRMFLPAELRGHGLPLSISLLTQRRFGLDLRRSDFQDAIANLPVIVANGHDVVTHDVAAHPTHDGFLAASIPVGDYQYAIGLQFGKLYEWVEVQSAEFVPADDLEHGSGSQVSVPIQANVSLEGIELVAGNLLRCEKAGFVMAPPAGPPTGRKMVLRVIFRPIVARPHASDHSPGGQATVNSSVAC